MSSYPPGVTGFEPQIAGEPEQDATREVSECARIGDVVVTSLGAHGRAGERKSRRATGVTCGFGGGEVEGTLVGDPRMTVTFYWNCPACGTENDTEVDPVEFEPDPDDRP